MSQSNQRAGRRPGRGRRGSSRSRGGRSRSTANQGPIEPLHPSENPPEIESFAEFDLHETVQQAILDMQIVKPTPIQALAIDPVLKGKDVIAKAETGTGKTLAFGAPMISKIDAGRSCVLGLVLTPTRELAEQVATVLEQLGAAQNITIALIVGGEPAGPQVAALQKGAQVVVGTPGRVIDLYEQKFLGFPWTEFVVLDEADEMLEIGFIDDVKKILQFTPDERQTLLFSATFPDALLRLARDYTTDPEEISTASGVKTVDNIEQQFITLPEEDRPLALIRMIERSGPEDVFLIFCERRTDVERLMRRLERLSFSAKALHGGYDQSARFRVMSAFRTGDVKALVATDVASRGLDVKQVTRVVNFSPPRSITAYTHRIGRTGRAGRQGHAVTFVSPPNRVRWNSLLRDASWEISETAAPGSQFSRGRRADSNDARPTRERSTREARPQHASRAEEDRPRRSRRDAEPVASEREQSRAPRPVRSPAAEDGPVELPANRSVRRRDPNDPPRRVRRSRAERESEPAADCERSSEREQSTDREWEDRPRRRNSRRNEAQERPRPARRERIERPEDVLPDEEGRPARLRPDEVDQPRRSRGERTERPGRSQQDERAAREQQPESPPRDSGRRRQRQQPNPNKPRRSGQRFEPAREETPARQPAPSKPSTPKPADNPGAFGSGV